MNITITTKAIPPRISLQEIVDKLNTIAGSSEFFTVSISGISFARNASPALHTKLILILGLYINSLYGKYKCYLALNAEEEYAGQFFLKNLPLQELNDFIDSIGNVIDVSVNIS